MASTKGKKSSSKKTMTKSSMKKVKGGARATSTSTRPDKGTAPTYPKK